MSTLMSQYVESLNFYVSDVFAAKILVGKGVHKLGAIVRYLECTQEVEGTFTLDLAFNRQECL